MMEFKVAHFPHGIISQSQKTNTGKEQSLEEASLGWSSGPETRTFTYQNCPR